MMAIRCGSCGICVSVPPPQRNISSGICDACLSILAAADDRVACRAVINAIPAPILMMQPDPRQVFTTNDRALALFGRPLDAAEDHRGGEVFGCIHSFTEAGCGKDANCEDCRIKGAIVDIFMSGASAVGVSSILLIRLGDDVTYDLTVSTEKVGRHALVKIERFERCQ